MAPWLALAVDPSDKECDPAPDAVVPFAPQVRYPTSKAGPALPEFERDQLETRGWVTGYRSAVIVSQPIAAVAPEIGVTLRFPQLQSDATCAGKDGVISLPAAGLASWPAPARHSEKPMPTPFGDMLASLLSKWPQLTAGNEIALPKVPVAGCLPSCSECAASIDPARVPLREPFPARPTSVPEVLPAETKPAKPLLGEGQRSWWRVGATDDARTKPAAGAQPRGPAWPSPVPAWEVTLSARVAIRSVRLGRPADRLPLRLAMATGADAPAGELFPAVRLWPRAPVSPATTADWKYGVILSRGARAVAPAGTPLEWAGVVRQPTVLVTVPEARSAGGRSVFGCAPVVRSGWRIAGPAGGVPVEFLEKGSGLLACEYRTRSML